MYLAREGKGIWSEGECCPCISQERERAYGWQEKGRASSQRESAARALGRRGKEHMFGKKREGHLVRGKVLRVHLAGGEEPLREGLLGEQEEGRG